MLGWDVLAAVVQHQPVGVEDAEVGAPGDRDHGRFGFGAGVHVHLVGVVGEQVDAGGRQGALECHRHLDRLRSGGGVGDHRERRAVLELDVGAQPRAERLLAGVGVALEQRPDAELHAHADQQLAEVADVHLGQRGPGALGQVGCGMTVVWNLLRLATGSGIGMYALVVPP
jgi:hypothetical protein